MRQTAAIVFLAMCASGLVVAASWNKPLTGPPHPVASIPDRANPSLADGEAPRQALASDVDMTVTFHGQPVAGKAMHASVSATDEAGIVSWSLDDAPAWIHLTSAGKTATLTGTVPADASDVSFTVAAKDAAGRTFYAGSGEMPLSGAMQVMTSGPAIGSAMALPMPADSPTR